MLASNTFRKQDDITMFAYKHGKALCWNCTCVDNFASTHANESAVRAGSAANAAETVIRAKYRSLTDRYQFEAVTIETAGTYSEGTKNIVRDFQSQSQSQVFIWHDETCIYMCNFKT